MYKVLIAEDELLVRMGLVSYISWRNYGMRVVAAEADGEAAWARLVELEPDVVITDLRMPLLDGQALIRRIRESGRRCEIIVITCAEDFATVQALFNYDIRAYLLKATMTNEDIVAAILRVREVLKRYEPQGAPGGAAYSEEEKLEAWLRAGAPTEKGRADFGFPCTLAVVRLSDGLARETMESARGIMQSGLSAYDRTLVARVGASFCCLLPSKFHSELWLAMFREIKTYIGRTLNTSVTAAVYDEEVTEEETAAVFRSLDELLGRVYFLPKTAFEAGRGYVCDPELLLAVEELSSSGAVYGFMSPRKSAEWRRLCGRLAECVKTTREEFDRALRGLAEYALAGKPNRAKIYAQLIENIEASTHALEACKAFERLVPAAQRALSPANEASILRTVEYIGENAGKPVTLGDMARLAGFSPNYYAALFKLATGCSFSEYLSDARLHHACEYLKNSSMTIQEISRLCGFADTAYFIRVFKQKMGKSPRQWRMSQ